MVQFDNNNNGSVNPFGMELPGTSINHSDVERGNDGRGNGNGTGRGGRYPPWRKGEFGMFFFCLFALVIQNFQIAMRFFCWCSSLECISNCSTSFWCSWRGADEKRKKGWMDGWKDGRDFFFFDIIFHFLFINGPHWANCTYFFSHIFFFTHISPDWAFWDKIL